MKNARRTNLILLFVLLVAPLALIGQDKGAESQEKGSDESKRPQVGIVEFGARGDVGEKYMGGQICRLPRL
jgi:hypothetical protein